MNKPENLEEVKEFIYEKLREKYGENVVIENDSRKYNCSIYKHLCWWM